MEYLISLLGGLSVALLAYRLWPISESGLGTQTTTAYAPVEEQEESQPLYRSLLLAISRSGPLTKYAPEMLVKRIARQLYWAQLFGQKNGERCCVVIVVIVEPTPRYGGSVSWPSASFHFLRWRWESGGTSIYLPCRKKNYLLNKVGRTRFLIAF